jgi:hypothetical protein
MANGDPTVCPECGGRKNPNYSYCYKCSQKQREQRGTERPDNRQSRGSIENIVFDTFLTSDGYVRKEAFINTPKKAASAFREGRKELTQSQIRSAFHQLKALNKRLQVDKEVPTSVMEEVYNRFQRWAQYQVNRDQIPRAFLEFVEAHRETATSSKEEFHGFMEYLTSILVELKGK